ncbi:MAG: hypothetical protein FWF03_08370, partial [Defluviitaleaceae bacterium]|nr:hypothetical protein [Defluviitaleaceae bacterium]
MVKTLSLASALLKNAGSPFDVRFGKKKGRIAQASIYLLLLLGLLPILAGLFIVYREMYGLFAPTGDLAYATGTMLNLLCVVIFIFTLFSAPSIYYLSKDVGFLLPLPIRPAQIIGAKFIVSLVYEYVFALFLLAPMYAAYVVKMPAPALTINMALAFAALPVAPMVYATVIVMLLMRLSGFGKNRDAYNMVVGVAAICFGLAVTMYSSNLNLITTEQVVSMVDGNRGALGALKSIFPGSVYAGRAIADADFLAQAADLLISALTAAAFIMLAQLIYFKGVVGVSESNAPQGRMTREGIMRGAYERKILPSYFMKEILTLVRSPVAFLNCVLIVFILPPLTAAPMLMNMGGAGADLGFNLSIDFSDPRVFAVAMSVAAAAGLLMSSVAMAAPTSISREGSNYIFMKYIPVPYAAQIEAKALCGAAIGVLGSAFLALMS